VTEYNSNVPNEKRTLSKLFRNKKNVLELEFTLFKQRPKRHLVDSGKTNIKDVFQTKLLE
jgi:hypothetical protein